ncbi:MULTISPECIES: hypothetical protein [unclassified Micromonospora]|uniref:hypothetical protein n=1 Tax=unclassified Micromonospora TaxID=2617518 RepID=UPI0022B5F889|nr:MULTISPECIES: hypothetical protein [unclassified Micromonospora]MCZ7423349.1 hypothetical protein [Verrucosispora sp. WMMA2121]WBB91044.1 hypothetical protein O7597_29495 [Verrucosispora sp. WMMC514]
MSDVPYGVRHAALATALAAVLAVTGCAPEPEAEPPPPSTGTSPPNTLAQVDVGDALTVTAAVDRVVDERALVVRDVDLADRSLLVLTRQPVEATPPQLLSVEGTVVRFSYRRLAARHHLTDPAAYRTFEGQKALVAGQVTVWR